MSHSSPEATERLFYYNGKWNKIGDYLKIEIPFLKFFKRFVSFELIFIGCDGCAQVWRYDLKRRMTLIGDVIYPEEKNVV